MNLISKLGCAATALLFALAIPALRAADAKPVFLYSRYFNAPGEARYLADGNYREVLQRLAKDFRVRTHEQPLNAATLAGANVVLIANPSDVAVSNQPAPSSRRGPGHPGLDSIREGRRRVDRDGQPREPQP